MLDAVLSVHPNPQTCGVTKFGVQLAERLGVPHDSTANYMQYRYPLVNVKTSEVPHWWDVCPLWTDYDLFLHDIPVPMTWFQVKKAKRVFAANSVIAEGLKMARPDVISAWCPSTVQGNADRGKYRVLTFGMAHKLVIPHFQKLREHLEEHYHDYTISLSTAVHEGQDWAKSLKESADVLQSVFGGRLRVLGYLADDALAREIQECDAVAAYFPTAFRENNTSAWAALAAGKRLFTNVDDLSPAPVAKLYGWDRLMAVVRA
jgi:hypothetical protein